MQSCRVVDVHTPKDQRHQERPENSQNGSECGADQPLEANLLYTQFEENDGRSDEKSGPGCNERGQVERLEVVGTRADYKDKDGAHNRQIEHKSPPPGGSEVT